jgi:hypothetical protein
MSDFQGFDIPHENWSKLPHVLIDLLPVFSGKGELGVVLYILRHTWGYQEFGSAKKITLDEFMKGRKRRDGTRIDNGVGMTKSTIITALKKAQANGFITVETDDSDAARQKKYYSLRLAEGYNNYTPEVQQLDPGGSKTIHRSEKDTKEKKPEKGAGKPAKTREPDVIWDALVAVTKIIVTDQTRGKLNTYVKELKEIEATVAEIEAAAELHAWKETAPTPQNILESIGQVRAEKLAQQDSSPDYIEEVY